MAYLQLAKRVSGGSEGEARRTSVRDFGKNVLLNGVLGAAKSPLELHSLLDGVSPFATPHLKLVPVFEGDSSDRLGIPWDKWPMASFTGKPGQEFFTPFSDHDTQEHLLFVGLGKRDKFDAESVRDAVGKAVRKAEELNLTSIIVAANPCCDGKAAAELFASAAAEAGILAAFHYDFKTTASEKGDISRLYLPASVYDAGTVEAAAAYARGQNIARVISGMPSVFATPMLVAEAVQVLGSESGFQVNVFDVNAVDAMGMGGIYNVGKGSVNPPCLIQMDYMPQGVEKPDTIVLVGKGITMDTGGPQTKGGTPDGGMHEMKFDKGGAAAVIGAIYALAQIKPNAHIVGLACMAENVVSGNSYLPGAVIQMRNGQTVEVVHTDAEGRLVLADGIAFGAEMNPIAIVEASTLTGGMIIAVGDKRVGLFTENRILGSAIQMAAATTGELIASLDIPDMYGSALKSHIADLAHHSLREKGGSTYAALFLSKFAGDVPFAHLDIAPIVGRKPTSYVDDVASGATTRLLAETARLLSMKPTQ